VTVWRWLLAVVVAGIIVVYVYNVGWVLWHSIGR
jgi:hypothetical protein